MEKIKRLLCNRVTVTSILVLLQVGFILLEIFKLGSFYVYISVGLRLISLLVTCYLIYKPMNPEMKLAWIVCVLALPLFGGAIFLIYGHVIIPRKLRDNLNKVHHSRIKGHLQQEGALSQLRKEHQEIANQSYYIEKYGGMPVYQNSEGDYLKSGEIYFKRLIDELMQAKDFIFIEYFIIKPGKMWDKIHSILKEKVQQGVEVRVMYDDVGSGFSLPNHYAQVLEGEGIKCVTFNKLFPLMALILNNRDHRKVVVIDGKVAFTGGINIADEYINEEKPYGHWKDIGICIKGEAVWNFTVLFLQMWNTMRFTESDYLPYKVPLEAAHFEDGYIQPYGSAPLEKECIGETVYFNMISYAKKSIYIYTPYLILEHGMLSALARAAKRGVDVRIVTPGIPDKKKVYWLTQSCYRQLLKEGIHIMQYTPGFIHAKAMLCDGELASIGTINFDYRSFYHHFECSTLLYQSKVCKALGQDMEALFTQCETIDLEWCQTHLHGYPVMGLVLKLFAPLL